MMQALDQYLKNKPDDFGRNYRSTPICQILTRMKNQKSITIIFQAQPNSFGVDFARLVLNQDHLKHVRELYALLAVQKLTSLSTDVFAVQWIKDGLVFSEGYTVCEVYEGGIGVTHWMPCQMNAQVAFNQSESLNGLWILGGASDLDTETLHLQANENGEIFAEYLGSSFLDQVDNIAKLQFAHRNSLIVKSRIPLNQNTFAWPNPYKIWGKKNVEETSSRRLLPASFIENPRSTVANSVLGYLMKFALKASDPVDTEYALDPNKRCALYTLAAALIICPDDVGLYFVDASSMIPNFLLSRKQLLEKEKLTTLLTQDHLLAHEASRAHKDISDSNLFEVQNVTDDNLTIRLVYENLRIELKIETADKFSLVILSSKLTNLALVYEDILNDDFAHRIFVDFSSKYIDDFSRLKILAMGMDSLKRLLDTDYPWYEDMRVWLENSDLRYAE